VGAKADFSAAARLFEAATPPHTVEAARAHACLGVVLARQSLPEEAIDEAAEAMALAGGDVTTLHNIACVYAEAAESKAPKAPQRRDVLQRLAMKFLARAIHVWRDHPTRADGYNELRLLQDDPSLASIRARPDFPDWLARVSSEAPGARDRH
jgi:hypothetical protein